MNATNLKSLNPFVLPDVWIDVHAQDMDGNTTSQYLATTLNGNSKAMQRLQEIEAKKVYNNYNNREDLMPRALYDTLVMG